MPLFRCCLTLKCDSIYNLTECEVQTFELEKKVFIVIYRQITEVNSNINNTLTCLIAGTKNFQSKESTGWPSVETDRLKAKVEAKLQEYIHFIIVYCTHSY